MAEERRGAEEWPMGSEKRYCIIGAGYAGLGIAKAFNDAGTPYDHFEKNAYIGGNWADGVYDSTHIISSRDSTAYAELPMPPDYPDFPSKEQMLGYLEQYTDHFGLRETIQFETAVTKVEPIDANGMAGWRVTTSDGQTREYAGVIVCNGHHWATRKPEYRGEFSGKQLYGKHYKNPNDFEGERVLVVGSGNTGCDIAVEAAHTFGRSWISMRRGDWILPKTLFGIPTAELDKPFAPVWLQKRFMKLMVKIVFGSYERYGLPKPDYDLFDKHPIVNSQLLYHLRHGVVLPRPGIERIDGRTVDFVDGQSDEFDTIIWATGYDADFPFLDHRMFEWDNGIPKLVGPHVPGKANLFIFGLLQPRGGAGPLISAGARLLANTIRVQQKLDRPIVDLLQRFREPTSDILVGVSETMRQIKMAELGLKRMERALDRGEEPPPPPAPVRLLVQLQQHGIKGLRAQSTDGGAPTPSANGGTPQAPERAKAER
jgi:hypothetical protein